MVCWSSSLEGRLESKLWMFINFKLKFFLIATQELCRLQNLKPKLDSIWHVEVWPMKSEVSDSWLTLSVRIIYPLSFLMIRLRWPHTIKTGHQTVKLLDRKPAVSKPQTVYKRFT